MKAIIDTTPKNLRAKGSVNLGYELVAEAIGADKFHWSDTININKYDAIWFNVYYPTNIFNIAPFLTRNGLSPYRTERNKTGKTRPMILAGGQGVGTNGLLYDIADDVGFGEWDNPDELVYDPTLRTPYLIIKEDGSITNKGGYWKRKTQIDSPPQIKGKKAVIELTRGCKYRCAFCEYGWVAGGKYREKDLELVKEQIQWCLNRGIKRINFLSANFGGYSKISELIQYSNNNGVFILNSDISLNDFGKLEGRRGMSIPKIGIESFCQKTRYSIGKRISDDKLTEILRYCMDNYGGFHGYLIYGLPGDNYDYWMNWIELIGKMLDDYTVKTVDLLGEPQTEWIKNVRVDFNISNFEPCKGTPLANAPLINFAEKDIFLDRWGEALIKSNLVKATKLNYGNCKGRFGRKKETYELLMALKTRGPEITKDIIESFPNGVGRSIPINQSAKFVERIGGVDGYNN